MMYVAGLDLGQMNDYTALAILEVHEMPISVPTTWGNVMIEGLPIREMKCRHLERFPLQTRYPEIAEKVLGRMRKLPKNIEQYLAVDKTGVGAGPYDILDGYKLNPIGVTITNGNRAMMVSVRDWHVPKRDLVGAAQVGLQTKVLSVADKLPMASVLCKELQNFKMKISADGHDSYNAWRESDHDDLVLAVSIAGYTATQMVTMNQNLALGKIQEAENQRRWRGEGEISPI